MTNGKPALYPELPRFYGLMQTITSAAPKVPGSEMQVWEPLRRAPCLGPPDTERRRPCVWPTQGRRILSIWPMSRGARARILETVISDTGSAKGGST